RDESSQVPVDDLDWSCMNCSGRSSNKFVTYAVRLEDHRPQTARPERRADQHCLHRARSAVSGRFCPPGRGTPEEGQLLVGLGNQGIVRLSANGGKAETIITVKQEELAHGPQLLPGGDVVLFTLAQVQGSDRWNKAQIVAQSLKTGERKVVIDGGSDPR